jgi:ankyrin repeat protein
MINRNLSVRVVPSHSYQRYLRSFWLGLLLMIPFVSKAETINEIFLETAESGELSAVQHTLELGAVLDYQRTENGWTALMLASYNSHKDIVEFLLSKGAILDVRDKVGQTALMAAVSAEKPDIEIIQLLLKFGTNPNIQRKKDGSTALMLATKSERNDIVKILLANGANPQIQDRSGQTALDIASKNSNLDIIALLKSK